VVIVYAEPVATTTTLAVAQPDGDRVGNPVVLTATVARDPSGVPTPTGTVAFFEGSTNLGDATLDGSGVASITLADVDAGSHTYRAEFLGGSGALPSASTDVVIEVTAAPTSTTSTSSTSSTTATTAPGATGAGTNRSSGDPSGGGVDSGVFAGTGADPRRVFALAVGAVILGALMIGSTRLRRSRPA
jgi:hypothetical protein